MRRRAGLAALLLSAALLMVTAFVGIYGRSQLGLQRVKGLGNFEENVRALPPAPGGGFRFAVIGDPEEGLRTFRLLMRKAQVLKAAFVVITGDVVDRPTREAFELFNREYHSLGSEALPTFAAVGNHDESPLDLFTHYCGPADFHFVHERSLFIFAQNNLPSQFEGCARYVRETIEKHRGQVDHTFIVVHKPITDYAKLGGPLQEYRKDAGYLYRILDSESIDAVLAGHFHGYQREQYGKTLLLVTGGGGALLHDAAASFHLVLIDVKPDGIADTVVKSEGGDSALDRLRFKLVVRVYPLLFGEWWRPLIPLGAAAALLGVGLALRRTPRAGRMSKVESRR